ncbi:H-NS histone [Burkholderia pseudomallei]|uniref:H-NS histone family protein n=1 Tax=Burkholderia pseudomallei TaxID=28450 RepID=UPI0009756F22|nr:H-NS histone family protein [Burkholderia pseudomallei]ONC30514.1 H-NS histone [Burkholderia pseudomallei]
MSTYQELVSERRELLAQIEEAKANERRLVIADVRKLVSDFELTQKEVFGRMYKARSAGQKKARYRDPLSGATWTGLGRPPAWIVGKDRAQFAV